MLTLRIVSPISPPVTNPASDQREIRFMIPPFSCCAGFGSRADSPHGRGA
jgi:hypothetical protein